MNIRASVEGPEQAPEEGPWRKAKVALHYGCGYVARLEMESRWHGFGNRGEGWQPRRVELRTSRGVETITGDDLARRLLVAKFGEEVVNNKEVSFYMPTF